MLLSITFEIWFSYYNYYIFWQWICFRYLLLLPLGYYLARRGVKINMVTLALSLFSIIMILLFRYVNIDWRHLFYDNPWRIFHWPIYFYVVWLLLPFIHLMYNYSPKFFIHSFCLMGKCSYEIFLFQMLVFFVSDTFLREMIIGESRILSYIYMLCIIPLCILPVLMLQQRRNEIKSF